MNDVLYKKQRNADLFVKMKKDLGFTKIQNYQPMFNEFFELNESNFNSIQLKSKYYLNDMTTKKHYTTFTVVDENSKEKVTPVFIKHSPLLNPFNYLTGVLQNTNFTGLPSFPKTVELLPKLESINNAAYTESLFVFLSSKLMLHANFLNGVEYYGSYLGLKENYSFDVYEDLEYLVNCPFFEKEKNVSFAIEDYADVFWSGENARIKQNPIFITGDDVPISMVEVNDETELFDGLFTLNQNIDNDTKTLEEFEVRVDLSDEGSNVDDKNSDASSCSSRSSHTSSNISDAASSEPSSSQTSVCSTDSVQILATLPIFPVNLIAMERFDETLESLILDDQFNTNEWFACFMQIIMSLLTYQTAFSFTHNDLHTNNIMFKPTKLKFLYYKYNKKIYKVPTYGRIFSIIDFGRSIYKYQGKVFCGDCYDKGGDANSQYNCEPFYNEKKARIEPNYSFDLCRLGCALFDFLIDDIDDIKKGNLSPIAKLVVDWCTDDKGMNILYKQNGEDRYPDFKLYKMISRLVHKHTPELQLNRPEFSQFIVDEVREKKAKIVNIDNLKFEMKQY